MEQATAESLADFDIAAELVYRFVDEWAKYSDTYDTFVQRKPGSQQRSENHYVSTTNRCAVAFTFIRSATAMASVACFWIAADWPNRGLAFIGVELVCALTSTAPNARDMAVQMAFGAALATAAGYAFTCYVYPNIGGFPFLCITLAPVLALGAHLATRKRTAGLGVGFSGVLLLIGRTR